MINYKWKNKNHILLPNGLRASPPTALRPGAQRSWEGPAIRFYRVPPYFEQENSPIFASDDAAELEKLRRIQRDNENLINNKNLQIEDLKSRIFNCAEREHRLRLDCNFGIDKCVKNLEQCKEDKVILIRDNNRIQDEIKKQQIDEQQRIDEQKKINEQMKKECIIL